MTPRETLAELDEWERICEAATDGPWGVQEHADNMASLNYPSGTLASFGLYSYGESGDAAKNLANAHLCCTSRTAVPALIAALRECEAVMRLLVEENDVALEDLCERAREILGER